MCDECFSFISTTYVGDWCKACEYIRVLVVQLAAEGDGRLIWLFSLEQPQSNHGRSCKRYLRQAPCPRQSGYVKRKYSLKEFQSPAL